MSKPDRQGIVPPKSARELVDMYYLEARSHLLETAAILDRIERAADSDEIMDDPRIENLFKLCHLLAEEKSNRAEKFLNLLSV